MSQSKSLTESRFCNKNLRAFDESLVYSDRCRAEVKVFEGRPKSSSSSVFDTIWSAVTIKVAVREVSSGERRKEKTHVVIDEISSTSRSFPFLPTARQRSEFFIGDSELGNDSKIVGRARRNCRGLRCWLVRKRRRVSRRGRSCVHGQSWRRLGA